METLKLKKLIEDFNNGVIYNDNPSFVSLIVVEDLLKRKRQEFLDRTKEYVDYLSKKLKIKVVDFEPRNILTIWGEEKVFNPLIYDKLIETLKHTIEIYFKTGYICWRIGNRDIKQEYIDQIKEDEKTKEYINFVRDFEANYFISFFYIATNLSFRVSMEYNFANFKIIVNDDEKNVESVKTIFSDDWLKKLLAEMERNFYYYKSVNENKRAIQFNNEDIKSFLNEELLGKIYASLKIDISTFPRKLQEEIRQAEISLKASLSEKQNEEMLATRELQIERIMKAYALIKEATELLSLAKSEIGIEKIKLDNINSILFKNNGLPNSLGYIEFEEFFKNNMILRMLDLSTLDLTNVDIRGIDFSGTNVHIDPQRIYNKDMSYVNATDVKFSPFFDSFQDVILDGTIINDHEANINLDLVLSHNNDTHISKEVVRVLFRP